MRLELITQVIKMELPEPRNQGKKPTHDFLSLSAHSSFPDPTSSQGNGLTTHDFLQPLERVRETSIGEDTFDKMNVEKASFSSSSSPSPSVEHILPGGIGTYTISHISSFNQKALKNEQTKCTVIKARDAERSIENKNASYSSDFINGGKFTIWEENVKETGKKVKHTIGSPILKEQSENLGHWPSPSPSPSERPSQPPFHHSKPIRKNQSFVEMMKSERSLQEDEEDDDEDFANSSKKSTSSLKDGKSGDNKPNTPRSKHSATEQRRRSKINDRFQILRDIIPQNDQKRDKASFLLEVIEYIQYLQEKVNKYDTSFGAWNHEPTKLTPWRNGHAPVESRVDHSPALKGGPGTDMMFTGKFDDNIIPNHTVLANTLKVLDPGLISSATYKAIDHHTEVANNSGSVPISLHTNMSTSASQHQQQPISEEENMVSQPQSQMWPNRPCTTDCPVTSDTFNEREELTIEGGTISLEGVYSQGLLNNLTQALQSSGVDLSQASISVQVDIGKRAISRLNSMGSGAKDDENPSGNQAMAHSRIASSGEDSDHTWKRPRTQ